MACNTPSHMNSCFPYLPSRVLCFLALGFSSLLLFSSKSPREWHGSSQVFSPACIVLCRAHNDAKYVHDRSNYCLHKMLSTCAILWILCLPYKIVVSIIFGMMNIYSYLQGWHHHPVNVSLSSPSLNCSFTWSENIFNKSFVVSFFPMNGSEISVWWWSSS